jgi:hypothetical protein
VHDADIAPHEPDVGAFVDQPAALQQPVELFLVGVPDLAATVEDGAVEPDEPRVVAERGGKGRAACLVPAVGSPPG